MASRCRNKHFMLWCVIYKSTTKIYGVVCPPNISETVAGRLIKLAHRQRIASTTIELISKTNVTVHFINFSKNNSANRCWPEAQIIAAIWFGRLRSQSRSPCPGFGQNAVAIYRVRVKRFSQSEFSSTIAAFARTTFRLDRFRNHSHSAFSCVKPAAHELPRQRYRPVAAGGARRERPGTTCAPKFRGHLTARGRETNICRV